jgi:putative nucleotidyltransferase with HDIG domain
MNRIPHLRDAQVKSTDASVKPPGPGGALQLWVAGLAVVAAATAITLVARGASIGNIWAILALGIASAVAERGTVKLSSTTELTISPVLTLFAAVLYGPLAGGLVGAASELGEAELFGEHEPGRNPRLKWLTYTSSRFIIGVSMGLVAQTVLDRSSETAGLVVATLLASLVGESLEVTFASVTSALRGNHSPIARTVGPLMVTATCVYGPFVAALAYMYTNVSPWTAFFFLAPVLAAQQLFSLYQEKARLYREQVVLTDELRSANDTLRGANLSFATALVQTLEESDRYTAGHSRAVATYSRDIAERMGLGSNEQERVYLCGLVHDIGKIGLPSSVLNKEGLLTLEERRQMEKHSEIGERILEKVAAYSDVALIVRHHHERADGEGYPDRLCLEDIPPVSRIIAVADAYNAMTSDRPYRKAMDYVIARDRLLQAMGSQFDTEPIIAFLAVLAGASDDYRRAKGDGFGDIDTSETLELVESSLALAHLGAA